MRIIYFSFFLASVSMFNSCGSEDEQGEQMEFTSSENEVENDSIEVILENEVMGEFVALSDRAIEGFVPFFSPELMAEMDQYLDEFNNISTDTEFQRNYEKGIELFKKMYSAFYEPQTKYFVNSAEKEIKYFFYQDLAKGTFSNGVLIA